MPAALDASLFSLAIAMGISAYIGVLHLWFWRWGRGESMHIWVALWCGASLAFQAARAGQVIATEPAAAVAMGRAQVALAFPLTYALTGFAATLVKREWASAKTIGIGLAALLCSAVALSTPLFISGQTDVRVDFWRHEYIGTPGTPAMGAIVAMMLVAWFYVAHAARAAAIEANERRVLAASLFVYLGCAVASVFSAMRLAPIPMLTHYSPLAIALGLNYMLVHRHRRLTTELEAMVDDRAHELHESERRYRRLVEDAPIGVIACDPAGRVTATNPYLVALFGAPSERELAKLNLLVATRSVETALADSFRCCLQTESPLTREFEYTSRWNRPLVVRAQIVPLRDRYGALSGAQAILEDISERARLEHSLRQSRKMEAVGQLAAGIAHEINNPMAYVQSNLRMLRDECAALEEDLRKEPASAHASRRLAEIEELIDESLEGVERTVDLVREVKEFSHGSAGERELADLRDVLEDALRYASPQKPPRVTVERIYGELPRLDIAPNQLRQVFLNLIVNSFQAIGDRGTVRLITRAEGSSVIVRIEDDGSGIPVAIRERIFEPFFTTKPAGQGTGLGLYFSYQIARLHGAELRVESTQGIGTAFEMRLPTVQVG